MSWTRPIFASRFTRCLTRPDVEFIGELSEQKKGDFLRNASALLFPICWPEPFGLVMIEAMACGTPVLAFDHGSVREVVDDGITGRVVTNFEEAVRELPRRHAARPGQGAPPLREALLGAPHGPGLCADLSEAVESIALRTPSPARPRPRRRASMETNSLADTGLHVD